jgi:DNA/RNA endonuclease G (NUC1)
MSNRILLALSLPLILGISSCLSPSQQVNNTSAMPDVKASTTAIADGNLRWGKPCITCAEIDYQQFVVCHDNTKKVPLWSVYESRPEDLGACDTRPKAQFIPEPSLPAGQRADVADYKAVKTCREGDLDPCPKPLKAKYDIGHMTPCKAMCQEAYMDKTFVLSNAVPQFWKFNETPWNQLEGKIDKFAKTHKIWVYTGPIFRNSLPLEKVGVNKVWVPTDCYKIVIYEVSGKPRAFAFIGKNVMPVTKTKLSSYVTTIDNIEALTGLDFLKTNPPLPKSEEDYIESTIPTATELTELEI